MILACLCVRIVVLLSHYPGRRRAFYLPSGMFAERIAEVTQQEEDTGVRTSHLVDGR